MRIFDVHVSVSTSTDGTKPAIVPFCFSSSWSPFFGILESELLLRILESELLLRSFLMSLGDSTLARGNLQCQLVQCFPLPFPLGSLPPLGTCYQL